MRRGYGSRVSTPNRETPNGTSPVETLRSLHHRLAAEEGLDTSAIELDLWDSRLALAACRRELAPDAPLLTVLLGPTGAGKSTLLSALAGREIAAASALRPCTMRALAIGAPGAVAQLASDVFLRERAPDVEWCGDAGLPPAFAGQVVVDTPDFDSVLGENRRRALPLFERADRVIVVLTPEKYGDAIVWQTIDALRPLGNVAAVIFNKTEGTVALDDATVLLGERGFAPPLAVPRVDSEASLSDLIATAPSLSDVLACHDPAGLRASLREHAAAEERRLREGRVAPFVAALARAAAGLEVGAIRIRRGLRAEIKRSLALRLDDALRRELQRRLVAALQRFDVTRGARDMLAVPLRRLRGWLSAGRVPAVAIASVEPIEWLASMHNDRFHRLHLDLVGRVRDLARTARDSTTPPWPWPRVDAPERSASHAMLLVALRGLEQEIHAQSDLIAQRLPTKLRVQFIGSQVVFHAMLVAIFVKTGGMLGGGEVAVQGLLSPFLARLVNHLVSSAEVEAIEQRLGEQLADLLETSLQNIVAPLDDALVHLRDVVPDVATFMEQSRAVDAWLAELPAPSR